VAAETRFAVAHAWNHLLVLGLIGLILFALPAWQSLSPQALTGYVVTTLYLMGPLAGVMGSLSVFGRASVALAKVEELGLSLAARPVSYAGRDDYRQLFSAVFADFFLFENLLGLRADNLEARARDYLGQLHLDHKVRVRDGAFSTTALSQGQRKRLALLTAYL